MLLHSSEADWIRGLIQATKASSPMARNTTLEHPRNSAARIVNVLIRAAGQSASTPSHSAWAAAFELESHDDGYLVTELLKKMRNELSATESALERMEVPPHLYKYAAQSLRSMLVVSNLSQAWGNISAGAAEQHIMAFRWAAYILPDESQQIETADIKELKELLADLEAVLEGASLPPVLHAYLSEQIAGMKAAIATAVVSGSADIRAALRKAVIDANLNDALQEEVAATDPAVGKEVRSKFLSLFKKGAEVAGDLEKYQKGFKLIQQGATWVIDQIGN